MSRTVVCTGTVEAAPQRVFDFLADPRNHSRLSGDRSVRRLSPDAPDRLALGVTFRVRMRILVPYWITNEVVEFEEGRCLAWKHYAGHVWRWQTAAQEGTGCHVTHTFDYSGTRTPLLFEVCRVPQHNRRNMRETLRNLARAVESAPPATDHRPA
ncbi:SRPBCC family protein [Streptomyces eurythermus]|uniref:SRPBCC family protein n=1 Tax=Streptomyces eurythermus TaxID=42237 RepID=UPI0036D2FEAA